MVIIKMYNKINVGKKVNVLHEGKTMWERIDFALKDKDKKHIYIPNEIFDDFKVIESTTQRAFAYSYYYYINYLYRYCMWIDGDGEKFTQERIKQKIGYSPTNKKINHIIKKDGVLDQIGYTETTNNYPLSYSYHEDFIEFSTISEFKDQIISANDRNFRIKKPIKSFYRYPLSQKQDFLDGTYYQVEYTHRINYSIFNNIMSNEELQTVGFYIYAYLKHKSDIFKLGYQRSFVALGQELGFSDKTIRKYVDKLEELGLIKVLRMKFDMSLQEDQREANVYKSY
jgi:hypothetical protein